MSDPVRTEDSRVLPNASEADRDAKIEQLLLVGLDHYFVGQYDQAINVWTRVLFLDRTHARARAYIDRARSTLAERQRESEELLQNGVAAFQRGEGREARRLLQAAIDGGAPSDEALALFDRMNRLDVAQIGRQPAPPRPERHAGAPTVVGSARGDSRLAAAVIFVLGFALAGLGIATSLGWLDWRALIALPGAPHVAAPTSIAREPNLVLPRRGDLALTRARALAAQGRLHDALTALDAVRPTDREKADADRLRGEIQRQLIGLTAIPSSSADSEKDAQRVP